MLYGDYNKTEFSLASIEVLKSQITQILSQWNANRCILFLIMHILHLTGLRAIRIKTHREKNKDATLLTSIFFIIKLIMDGLETVQ